MKPDRRMYGDLSWAWPIISPPEDYAGEAGDFAEAIEKHSNAPVRTLLDLGCGGGHNDFHLKSKFDVTGLDISDGMLANAQEINPEVRYLRGDMRTARLGGHFDSVIIADSIMYMLNEDDMLAAFRTAFEHLRPGGVFCTYAEELAGEFVRATTIRNPRKKCEIEITLIEHMWDPHALDTTFELLFIYLISQDGQVLVETDRHTCGLFSPETWTRLLKKAGFIVHKSQPKGQDVKYFFACTKPVE